MNAQITLTTSESKKLIAKAVVRSKIVQKALEGGKVLMHPSSSTIFILKEIEGENVKYDTWLRGRIIPKGACVSVGHVRVPPAETSYQWLIDKGVYSSGRPFGAVLKEMGPNDVYIKGVNAIDSNGILGVLMANPVAGGTLGLAVKESRKREFSIIYPVGLEKLVPYSIKTVAKSFNCKNTTYSMGKPLSLYPCTGLVINELTAVEILTGAKAYPIAAGGLAGAEGSITLIIKGTEEQITAAVRYAEEVKGAKLPPVEIKDCETCTVKGCSLAMTKKHWT